MHVYIGGYGLITNMWRSLRNGVHWKTLTTKIRCICTWFLTLMSFNVLHFPENVTYTFLLLNFWKCNSESILWRMNFVNYFHNKYTIVYNTSSIALSNIDMEKRTHCLQYVTFSWKWSSLKDVNVKYQVQLHLIFDVNVFQCTPFLRERHMFP